MAQFPTLLTFAGAATVAGLALGAGIWTIAQVLEPIGARHLALVVAALTGAFYGASEILRLRWRLPERRWQVPQRWGLAGRPLYMAAFGAILGVGFLTYIPYAGYYVLIMLMFGLADLTYVLLGALVFAWARTIPVIGMSLGSAAFTPTTRMARAVALSEQVVRLSGLLTLPRGALLLAAGVASIRALMG